MLFLNITEVCKVRQIERPYSFLVKVGISPHTASDIVKGYSRSIRMDHIEKICEALHCEPSDLFAYKPDNTNKLAKNHPLNKLIQKTNDVNLQQLLKTIPLEKLKEFAESVKNSKEE
ncbi:helix-turn-helix domain-containing protein [Flavobacterium sp. N1994]|uniref:helix-turn-helix domain-containing protein n=1 Tax=Flavobacterium sp. N1994 TaxID=2986827 RepID=UPI002221562C|nr:helix-turn-helix transcriptional regulator [Flavobacterium sp. N1994]